MDVPPFAVAVRNPARVVRFHFPEAVRNSLLRIAWWDWPRDKLAADLDLIRTSSAESFCVRHDPAYCHED